MSSSLGTAEWRVRANRITPLIDGEEYYPPLREALIAARHQILIVGWDLHTEIDLLRGERAEEADREGGWPYRLADLLLALLDARESLEIKLLIWEGSSLFLLERQHIPRMKWPWASHPRMELVWDRDTPRLSSHHQKLVVIDDAIAFAGGMDLTAGRWDTHDHPRQDSRRKMPGLFSKESQPYHDAMLALDGEAATTLGGWARERWRRATGEELSAPEAQDDEHDPWPESLEPILRHLDVGIALTQPEFNGRPEKRQVEASYIDEIGRARNLLFIESQYLTCSPIVDALCGRLQEEDGPEVIIILPYGCPGSLQAMCMDPCRDALLDQLREADKNGRFGAYWVTVRGGVVEKIEGDAVYIHAKTMVVDDTIFRIGSANLNNRSMGLDTELDVIIEIPEEDEAGRAAVLGYRQRLLAYLLRTAPETLAKAEQEAGSVLGAIEALRGGERTLWPFEHRAGPIESSLALSPELADPGRPMSELDADRMLKAIDEYTGRRARIRRRAHIAIGIVKRRKGAVVVIGLVIAIVVLWTATPVRHALDEEQLRHYLETLRSSPLGIVGVLAVFVVLASVGIPLTLLVAATGAMFDMLHAVPLCVAGVGASSYLSYMVGRIAPSGLRDVVSRNLPRQVERRLSNLSVLGVVVLRHIPLAPFAIVNIACGIVGVPRGRFLAGSCIGALPGILVLTYLGKSLTEFLSEPTPGGIAKVGGLVLGVIVLSLLMERILRVLDTARGGRRDREGE